jgi:hypothetical protein
VLMGSLSWAGATHENASRQAKMESALVFFT